MRQNFIPEAVVKDRMRTVNRVRTGFYYFLALFDVLTTSPSARQNKSVNRELWFWLQLEVFTSVRDDQFYLLIFILNTKLKNNHE